MKISVMYIKVFFLLSIGFSSFNISAAILGKELVIAAAAGAGGTTLGFGVGELASRHGLQYKSPDCDGIDLIGDRLLKGAFFGAFVGAGAVSGIGAGVMSAVGVGGGLKVFEQTHDALFLFSISGGACGSALGLTLERMAIGNARVVPKKALVPAIVVGALGTWALQGQVKGKGRC